MATITKNRNFFKWPKLLYFKPESAQISQESFQQSLVEIGSVVSEKKIFLISSPLFSNLHNRSNSVKVQSS
jgi:hypothetical protein